MLLPDRDRTHQPPECGITLIRRVLHRRIVHFESSPTGIVDSHYTSRISTSVAVIWGRPHCDERIVKHVLEALLHELMRSGYQRQRVDVVELQVQDQLGVARHYSVE